MTLRKAHNGASNTLSTQPVSVSCENGSFDNGLNELG